jgi:hypothetical protein
VHASATTISIPHPPLTSATAAVVDEPASTSGPQGPATRTSIILGTIIGVVIFLSLIAISIIYTKRKREEKLAQELKASTKLVYQTRSEKGLLVPLGLYRHPTSMTSSTSIDPYWGFGSQIHHKNQSVSPTPPGGAEGRPTCFEDTEARSRQLPHPDVAPASEPVEFPGHGHTDSIQSDYPYPVTYPTA